MNGRDLTLDWWDGHNHEPAAACRRSCPANKEMLMEKPAVRFHATHPLAPIVLGLNFGGVQCECGQRMRGQRRYREHFALVHVLGLA